MRRFLAVLIAITVLSACPAALAQMEVPRGKPVPPPGPDWGKLLDDLQGGERKNVNEALQWLRVLTPDQLVADIVRLSREKPDKLTAAWRKSRLFRNLCFNRLVPRLRGETLSAILACASDKSAGRLLAMELLVAGGYPAGKIYKEALSDGDASIRAAAAAGLRHILPDARVLDMLVKMAGSDEDPRVRAAAVAALAGAGREKDLKAVVAACTDKDTAVRLAAVKALLTVRTGEAAGALASVILNNEEERATRTTAMRAAAHFEHPKLALAVYKVLLDKDEKIQAAAFATLCAAGVPEMLELTCDRFACELAPEGALSFASNCRRFARNVKYFPDLRRRLVSTLVKALEHEDLRVREAAADSLRKIPFIEVTGQLAALVEKKIDNKTRKLICHALWRDETPEATAIFLRFLTDSDAGVSKSAALALEARHDARIGPAAVKVLAANERPYPRELIVLLAGSSDKGALTWQREILKNGSVVERIAVLQGAQRKGDSTLAAEMMPLLDSRERTVRLTAVEVLGSLKYRPAVAKLARLAKEEKDSGARFLTIKALAGIGSAQAVSAVLEYYRKFPRARRNTVAALLAQITEGEAKKRLRESRHYGEIREAMKRKGTIPDSRAAQAKWREEMLATYRAQPVKELHALAGQALSRLSPGDSATVWQLTVTAMLSVSEGEALKYLEGVIKEYPHWPRVMAAVARALQEHPVEGGEQLLRKLLYRSDGFVSASAASALTKTSKGEGILCAAMESPHRAVSKTAFSMLAKLGRLSEEKLSKALSDPDWSLREEASRALAKSVDVSKAEWLNSALGNEDPVVRRTVAQALGENPPEEFPETVSKFLRSDLRTGYWCFRAYAKAKPREAWGKMVSWLHASAMHTNRRGMHAAVAAASILGEEFLILVVKDLSKGGLPIHASRMVLGKIAPGRDVEFWQKWLKERKPRFIWSEEDCRFWPEQSGLDK